MYTSHGSWRSPRGYVDAASGSFEWVEIPNAQVMMHTGMSVMYRVAGRDIMVAPLHVGLMSTARRPGDIGTLMLPRWLAHDLGIVHPQAERGS